MSDRPPLTAAESDAMLAEAQRHQADFDQWVRGVLNGDVRLDGERRTAYQSGWRAGRLRLNDGDRKRAAAAFQSDAYQLVAWCKGYGEGRAAPKTTSEKLAEAERRKAQTFTAIREHASRG